MRTSPQFRWHPECDAERIQRVLLSSPLPQRLGVEFWVAVAGAVSIVVALMFGWLQ